MLYNIKLENVLTTLTMINNLNETFVDLLVYNILCKSILKR